MLLLKLRERLAQVSPKAIKALPLLSRYFSAVLNFLLIKYLLSSGKPELAAAIAIFASYFDAVAVADFGNRNKIIADQGAKIYFAACLALLVLIYFIVAWINPANVEHAAMWFFAYAALYLFILESYRLLYRKLYLSYSLPSIAAQIIIFVYIVIADRHGFLASHANEVLVAWTLLPIALPGLIYAFNRELAQKLKVLPDRRDAVNSISSSLLYLSSFFAVSYTYSWIKDPNQVVLLSVALRILNISGIYALWTQVHVVDYKAARQGIDIFSLKSLAPVLMQTLFSMVVFSITIYFAFPELQQALLGLTSLLVAACYVFLRSSLSLINAQLLSRDMVRIFVLIEGLATILTMGLRQFMEANFINAFASIAIFQIFFVTIYIAYATKYMRSEV